MNSMFAKQAKQWLKCWAWLLLLAPGAQAQELDIHGAMAQGFVLSEGNDYLGDSTSGSRDFYELAVNGRTLLRPDLLVSGQLLARRFGRLDDAKLRLDYAQLDWQFLSSAQGDSGIRVGKVKNPFGLFNDSRDVVFARPGILMPSSVYFEGTGFRDLFFSVEGAQLYTRRSIGSNYSEVTLGGARDFDATDAFERALSQGGLDGRVKISDFYHGQWLQDWSAGRWRTGISYLGAELELEPEGPAAAFGPISLTADIYVLSLQRLQPTYSLTFEYQITQVDTKGAGLNSKSSSDGAYLQYRQFLGADFEWYGRYDVRYSDRNDRDGREAAARQGGPRHRRFARDHVLGLQWRPHASWGVFAEYHYIDGTATVSQVDNVGQDPDRYWQMALLMLAYRF